MPAPRAEEICRQAFLVAGLAVVMVLFWSFSKESECNKRIIIATLICSLFAIWKVYRRHKSVYLLLIFVLEAAMLFSNAEAMKAKNCSSIITFETDPIYFIFGCVEFFIMWFDITIVMFFNVTILIYVGFNLVIGSQQRMRQYHQFTEIDPGLKSEERRKLNLSFYAPKKDDISLGEVHEHCSICLNVFSQQDQVITLPKCNHVFHQGCLKQWFDSNITCPYCRENIREALHSDLPVA